MYAKLNIYTRKMHKSALYIIILTSFFMTSRPVTGATLGEGQIRLASGPVYTATKHTIIRSKKYPCQLGGGCSLTITRFQSFFEEETRHVGWYCGRSFDGDCLPIGRHVAVHTKFFHHFLFEKFHFGGLSMN